MANKIMKTLFINGNTYEIVDEVARNDIESLKTNNVQITVEDVNDVCGVGIYQHPEDAYVKIGSPAIFSTSAVGEGLTYQWQYKRDSQTTWTNSEAIGFNTNDLMVTTVAGHNGLTFRCVVTDANNNKENTRSAKLSVWGITKQPENQAAFAGDTVIVSVEATSVATYQWQYGSDGAKFYDLPANDKWASATTDTLEVIVDEYSINWYFRCKLTGKDGSVIYTDTLYFVPILITKQPANVTNVLGNIATFDVSAVGEGITYQWQLKTSTGTTWQNSSATGNTTNNIEFVIQSHQDNFQYRCIITDAYGNQAISDIATLTLTTETFYIAQQPATQTAYLGDAVDFSVSAVGDGLTYQWEWKTADMKQWATTTLQGNNTATLTVEAQERRNGYMFQCVITDASGNTITSDIVMLTVKNTGIVITKQPENATATVGDTAVFSVEAVGNGLTYQWAFSHDNGTNWGNVERDSATTSELIMSNVGDYHNGYLFRCNITDANGNTFTSDAATLTVTTA